MTARMYLGALTLMWGMNCAAIELKSGYQVVSDVVNTRLAWTDGDTIPGNKPGWYYSQNVVPFMASGVAGTVVVSPVPVPSAGCASMYPMKSYDGYRGYEISPGILVIPFGSISGQIVINSGTMNPVATGGTFIPNGAPDLNTVSSASWDKSGNGSGDISVRSDCLGVKTTFNQSFGAVEMNSGGGSQSAMGYGVYVQPGAAKMAVKTVYAQAGRGYSWNVTPATFDRRILSLAWSGMDCTVNSMPAIAFGDVTPDEKSVNVNSSVDVTCSNPSGTALPVSYSVTPKTQAGDHYSIPMMSTSGTVDGDVRGFLGASATTEAGCADRTSSLPMDGTKVSLHTVTTSTNWSDPLVWVLCPRTAAEPGPATAAVTLDMSW